MTFIAKQQDALARAHARFDQIALIPIVGLSVVTFLLPLLFGGLAHYGSWVHGTQPMWMVLAGFVYGGSYLPVLPIWVSGAVVMAMWCLAQELMLLPSVQPFLKSVPVQTSSDGDSHQTKVRYQAQTRQKRPLVWRQPWPRVRWISSRTDADTDG